MICVLKLVDYTSLCLKQLTRYWKTLLFTRYFLSYLLNSQAVKGFVVGFIKFPGVFWIHQNILDYWQWSSEQHVRTNGKLGYMYYLESQIFTIGAMTINPLLMKPSGSAVVAPGACDHAYHILYCFLFVRHLYFKGAGVR